MSVTRETALPPSRLNTPESEKDQRDPETQAFLELAECFRDSEDPAEVARLGDRLGRLLFQE